MMIKNNKVINIEDVEMIDAHYFYIKKEPKFFCLEILIGNSAKEYRDTLSKKPLENDIAITTYAGTQNKENIVKLVYSSDSLKSLKKYTDNLKWSIHCPYYFK